MKVKDKLKDIGKYIGLGIVGGLTIINTTNAQENYKKPPTEIRQEGDNIFIPESKLEEFLKNYKPKKNITLPKQTGEITLDGYINNALTTVPLEGINIKILVREPPNQQYDTLKTTTNSQGHYSFMITGVDDQKGITNIGTVEYFNGKVRITTNNNKKIIITTYDILGQAITTLTNKEIQGTETIDLKLIENQPTITKIEIDGKAYTNIHVKNGNTHNIKKGKNIEQITEGNYKTTTKTPTLKKTQYVTGQIYITDQTNQNHGYSDGLGEITNNTKRDFSLIPRINLENQITDPGYNTIPTIKTIRDAEWYIGRVLGDWDNRSKINILWPIKLHIDTTNAPNEWKEEIRKVIQYHQDSLDIHPDSLLKEIPVHTNPSFSNGFSAINIIYTDSTVIGQSYSTIDMVLSSSNNAMIGGYIKINTPKITNKEDAGMIVAREIEKYILQSYNRIKDPRYLGNTTYNNLGTTKRPNNDEKKLIKIGRNSNKPIYINEIKP